jgi:serine phosphatase RsbU (regulator of sigma subunit)
MEIQIAVAKTNKFSSDESGDTLEVIERPMGGVSVVLADAKSSGRSAKAVSSMVVHQVIGLIAEGVRDGAAARAASDFLYTQRSGETSAYLSILSADLQTGTIVITRNNPTPVYIARWDRIDKISGECSEIGTSRDIKPAVSEIPLEPETTIVLYTDGVENAGKQYSQELNFPLMLESLLEDTLITSQEIADFLLLKAIQTDHNRPSDDMSVIVLRTLSHGNDQIRRMTVRLPVTQHPAP